MPKVQAQRGDFSGWSDEKCTHLVDRLAGLAHRRLTEGVRVARPRDQYLDEYRRLPCPANDAVALRADAWNPLLEDGGGGMLLVPLLLLNGDLEIRLQRQR